MPCKLYTTLEAQAIQEIKPITDYQLLIPIIEDTAKLFINTKNKLSGLELILSKQKTKPMKKLLLLSFVFLLAGATFAQKKGTITVICKYTGIVEGYDHVNKNIVFIDGHEVAASAEALQSVESKIVVKTTRGKHSIKVMNMALYEGNWEEHTKDNEYSVDAFYEGEINLKKKLKIELTFDIATETTNVEIE